MELFLNVGAIIPDETIQREDEYRTAFVYHQIPEIDSVQRMIKLGEEINLYLTKDTSKFATLDSLVIREEEL